MSILASLLVAATIAVDPVFTNHNSVVGSTQTMTNIQAWAAAVKTAVEQGGGGGGGESASSVTNIAMSTVTNTTQFSGYKDGSIVGRIVALENGGGGGCGGKVLRLTDSENIPANCYRGALCLEELYTDPSVAMGFQSKSFAYLPSLKKVVIGKLWNSATPIASDAFKNCPIEELVISNRTYSTFSPASYGIIGLKKISAPCATSISGNSFRGITTLEEIENLNDCVSIGNDSIRGCTSLKRVCDLPNCITIGVLSFEGDTNLEKIGDMPSCTSIGNGAFMGCRSLTSIGVITNCNTIDERAFLGTGFYEFTIPNLVSNIVGSTFRNCTSITNFYGVDHLVTIGGLSFSSCTAIKKFGEFSSLKNLTGSDNFGGCYNVEEFEGFPVLTNVSNSCFIRCRKLKKIGDLSSVRSFGNGCMNESPIESLTFAYRTHTEVESIQGFTYLPNRGTACVFHCSDGDFYRSGSSLLPMP